MHFVLITLVNISICMSMHLFHQMISIQREQVYFIHLYLPTFWLENTQEVLWMLNTFNNIILVSRPESQIQLGMRSCP